MPNIKRNKLTKKHNKTLSTAINLQNPFLCLQDESSQINAETKILCEAGNDILSILELLKIGIIENNIDRDLFKNLEHSLNKINILFHSKEILELSEQIRLRAYVEMAKFKIMQ